MKSRADPEFWRLYHRLPPEVRRAAVKQHDLFRENPQHPSLQFKQVIPPRRIHSARVTLGWRAVGQMNGDTITWFWIGPHHEYDPLLRRLR